MESVSAENRIRIEPRLAGLLFMAGIGLGILADRLFGTAGPFGLGFALWTVMFAAALLWLTRKARGELPLPIVVWSFVAVSAAATMLFRTVPIVLLGLLLVMAVAMAMILLHVGGRSLVESRLAEHFRALILVPLQGITGAWRLLEHIDIGAGLKHPQLWSGLRGALLALPLLLIFMALFSSADASFNNLVNGIFNAFSASTLRHVLLTLLFSWVATGLLASVPGNRFFASTVSFQPLKLATVDTAVLMGSLAALFLTFVYLQLGYLFGGREVIEATSGLTMAQYARRGFFELLIAAGLTLGILIVIAGSGCNRRVFRPLAAVLVGCVLIMQVSALQRLWLYIGEFGLTIDRLVALAVLAWLAFGILLFAATLLRGRTRLFAAGLNVSGVVVVFALAISNPGALVTKINISRVADHHRVLDTDHLLDLGGDAVPALVENLAAVPVPQRCWPVFTLYGHWYATGSGTVSAERNWQGWSFSQAKADRLIEDFEVTMKSLASSCVIGGRMIDFPGQSRTDLTVNGASIDVPELYRWINTPD